MNTQSNAQSRVTSSLLRRFLLLIVLLSHVGIASELLLLGHVESTTQLVPLVLLGIGLLCLGGFLIFGWVFALRAFRWTMALCLAAGVVGVWLHFTSNIEFELEMYPTMGGWTLFRESITGAIPTLAPGAMIQIGLVGLAYTLGHAALKPTDTSDSVDTGDDQCRS